MPSYADVVAELRIAGCVFAEEEAVLLIDAGGDLAELVRRRAAGEPVEHLLGWADFGGLRIIVDPGVFVPRRRTEHLARRTAGLVGPGDVVVDLCCGSGALAAFVRACEPGAEIHAVDLLPEAVACAGKNLGEVVHLGDLYAALPDDLRGRVDVVVCNAPHVPSTALATMPVEARDHEPAESRDGGPDGLDVVRAVVRDAPAWLRPGGTLLFEVYGGQAEVAAELCASAGLMPEVGVDDESGTAVIAASHN